MIGSRLGAWIIERELGRGGMGSVWLASRTTTGGTERAALKVLAPELATEAGFRQRFQREIDILRQLRHPHIVRFLESDVQDGRYFFAMEYVEGSSLQTVLEREGRLPWPDVLALALQMAPALKHAHDHGVIHRDLKPANILCVETDPDGPKRTVKLTDFGIASLFASPHLTVTGGVVGTAEYLSPEQAGGKPVTPRSDLYSLGVVLYTLLTGRTPFSGEVPALLQKHLFGQFERPLRLLPSLPPDLDQLLCDLLEKDPGRRPHDAGVLHRRLEKLRLKLERRETGALGETQVYATLAPDEPPGSMPLTSRARMQEGEGPGTGEQGPATLMSRLMREELERENRGTPLGRFLHHPAMLVALFLLCVGLLVWFFWPLSPETMYQRGAALMASEDPDDWQKAWDEFFEPLQRKHPDNPHRAEVEAFRKRLDGLAAERAAARKARGAAPADEAEWFYLEALRLQQQGKDAEARELLQRLITAFKDVPGEGPWVRLAERRLQDNAKPPRQWAPVERALERARQLEAEGRPDDARAIRDALRQLYRDDPQAPHIPQQ